jgi:hypothetical protein
MPELSRFFGIIIRMYAELGDSHHKPHFHAYYQDYVGIFSLDSVDIDCRGTAKTSAAFGRGMG